MITADEDFCLNSGPATEKGFGYMRVYDYANPAAPKQIGQYRTPNSTGPGDVAAGDYVIHNNFLAGNEVYSSWYTDGVPVVDVSNPPPADPGGALRAAGDHQPGHVLTTRRPDQHHPGLGLGRRRRQGDRALYARGMNSGLSIIRRTDR